MAPMPAAPPAPGTRTQAGAGRSRAGVSAAIRVRGIGHPRGDVNEAIGKGGSGQALAQETDQPRPGVGRRRGTVHRGPRVVHEGVAGARVEPNLRGLALRGEHERAAEFVAKARERADLIIQHAPQDGSWGEGVQYWQYGLGYFLRYLEASKTSGEHDYYPRYAWLKTTGFFPIHFSVPGNPGEGMVNALENVAQGHRLKVDTVLGDSRAVAIGTTSLTNKLITRGGAKVGLITTRGHEDAILVGRIISKSDGLSDAEKSDVRYWGKPEPIVERSRRKIQTASRAAAFDDDAAAL